VITGWIGAGSTFVVEDDTNGEVVGTLSLDQADPDFWTEQEASQPALYLYKFILRSDYRGNGLGDVLLDWASYRAERAGAVWLRLDCWRDNEGLHRYYRDRGFRQMPIRKARGRMSGARFERDADLRLARSARVHILDRTSGENVFSDPVGATRSPA
jgi:GNAT superfamily N-acetyltransferase